MSKESEGTIPLQKDKENEPKPLDPEKVRVYLREVINILQRGKKAGVTTEELQDVVDKTMLKLISVFDLHTEELKKESFE